MERSALEITVVGAGIGGLAAALALRQAGAKVTVLEQAEEITEVGAGIQVSPNGLRVMEALGLGGALASGAVRAQAVSLRDFRAGRPVARLDLSSLPPDQGYYFVHRADIINLLASACRSAGVSVRLLQKVSMIEPAARPQVHLVNGDRREADLVIGADGLHSRLRAALNGASTPFFTGQVAWRAVVPNLVGHPAEARVTMGPKCHVVSYPLRGGDHVNLVAVQERSLWAEESWHHADDPANLRAAFANFGGDTKRLIDAADAPLLWGLFRHPVAERWAGEGCVLVGDAAHPTLPFMAQGANMALEDAWVLADALGKAPTLAEGLAQYQTRRRARVVKVVEAANGNAWKYHLKPGPVRFGAHLGLRVLNRFAPDALLHQFDWLYGHDVTRAQASS